jgi:hypothetical protein
VLDKPRSSFTASNSWRTRIAACGRLVLDFDETLYAVRSPGYCTRYGDCGTLPILSFQFIETVAPGKRETKSREVSIIIPGTSLADGK